MTSAGVPGTSEELCEKCAGAGVCPTCNGTANVVTADETTACPDCTSGVCPHCQGSGRNPIQA